MILDDLNSIEKELDKYYNEAPASYQKYVKMFG
jgi:hypothetical protein